MAESTRVRLTDPRIRSFTCPDGKTQAFLWDSDTGVLAVRASRGGTKSFIFQSRFNNKSLRLTIGDVESWTIGEARERAREIQREIDQGTDPRQAKAEKIAKQIAKAEQAKADKKLTLHNLMIAYCDYLERMGRQSHKDVRSIVALHVDTAMPRLSKKPAHKVLPEDIADLMTVLIDDGKLRTANKLRSYVSAAYTLGLKARVNPAAPAALKAFKLIGNPARDTVIHPDGNRADKNPLSKNDLIHYWSIIKDMPGVKGAVLRLHLLTGGQRLAQLARLRCSDITDSTITLYDGKGSRRKPKLHIIPLIKAAKQALNEVKSTGDYALAIKGETHIHANTISKWAKNTVGNQIDDFALKRVRSGVETLLAANGWSRDLRGRLQSHGVSGVQTAHYDAYEYLEEKRQMLELLFNVVTGKMASVTPLRVAV